MRIASACLSLALAAVVGCGSSPALKPDPVEVSGEVKLPSGAAAKDLTVSFQPTGGDAMPAGAKLQSGGQFTVKMIPGPYVFYFSEEANAKFAAYKNVPEKYKTPDAANTVTIEAGKPVVLQLN